MCGRFTQSYTWSQVHQFLRVFGTPRNLRPRYNIAPTTLVDVVRIGEEGREIVPMRWGLVPGWWSKPIRQVGATWNARGEEVASKPLFREAFRKRRCIVPASGFYEWTGDKKDRQPHFFSAADGSPILAFPGLWDRWRDSASGEPMLSCTIILSSASGWMAPYHDRMPILLDESEFERWLSGEAGTELLKPAGETALREWPVSRRMNKVDVGDDDPSTIAPVDGSGDAMEPSFPGPRSAEKAVG